MKRYLLLFVSFLLICHLSSTAQTAMTNIQGRECMSLDGEWQVIVDMLDYGEKRGIPLNQTYKQTGRFVEYSFDNSSTLRVPGDWNSQRDELLYYESTIWYKKDFDYDLSRGGRYFLYFGAVNYIADVYLNGELIGSHEGGFSPFDFEVTGKLKDTGNFLIVRVNNKRTPKTIPAIKYDWWNYGGITRSVYVVHEDESYIRDYTVRLNDNQHDNIYVSVDVDGGNKGEKVIFSIPELKIKKSLLLSDNGKAEIVFKANPQLWNPEFPKLYSVEFEYAGNTIKEKIGFRSIEVKDTKILLNGKEIFLKGVNCHDEIPQEKRRAWSDADADYLLSEVKALGCNFLRLTHYPSGENLVRKAEEMGILLWEEIPLWQGIAFSDSETLPKANMMLDEMIARDKNRCAIIMWSMCNETKPEEHRNTVVASMIEHARQIDPSRLITSAFSHADSTPYSLRVTDPICSLVDVVGINKYYGWYEMIDCPPEEHEWSYNFKKPVIISEFGAGALYGNHGDESVNHEWYEEYQAKVYRDDLKMFENAPYICGLAPWCLFDFRSPYRFNHSYQNEWNRKGLLSDKGEKKMAWYIMKEYYDKIRDNE